MLALAPFNNPVIFDLLPGLTLAGLLFGILIYLSVRVAVWGYVVTDTGVRVVGLIATQTHAFSDMKATEIIQVWEPEHHPPQYIFGGYIVRDSLGGEVFRIKDCNDIQELEHEIQCGINLNLDSPAKFDKSNVYGSGLGLKEWHQMSYALLCALEASDPVKQSVQFDELPENLKQHPVGQIIGAYLAGDADADLETAGRMMVGGDDQWLLVLSKS
jgi:hypothetical protein